MSSATRASVHATGLGCRRPRRPDGGARGLYLHVAQTLAALGHYDGTSPPHPSGGSLWTAVSAELRRREGMFMIDAGRLRDVPFFTDFAESVVASLAADAHERDLAAGDLVIEQNDEAREVLFLVEGSVEVLLHYEGVGDLFMGSFQEPGSIFGWSALRPPYRYTDSVRCEQPTRLVCLSRANVERFIAEDPWLGFVFLQRVTSEVARQLEITRALLGQRQPQRPPVPAEADF